MAKGYSFTDLEQPTSCTGTPVAGGSLAASTTYYYRIIGVNRSSSYPVYWYGKSKCSDEFSATTDSTNKSIEISFSCSVGSNTSYRIFRTTTSNGQYNNNTSMIAFYPNDSTYNSGGTVTFIDTGYSNYSGNYYLEIEQDAHGILELSGSTSGDMFSIVDLYNADISNGWGVIKKLDVNTYLINCYLKGHNDMYWKDTEKTIIFNDMADFDKNNSYFYFGEKSGSNLTSKGCNIIITSQWLSSLVFPYLYAYRTNFVYLFPYTVSSLGLAGGGFRNGILQDCNIDRWRNFVPYSNANCTIKNCIFSRYDNLFSNSACTFDGVKCLSGSRAWQISGGSVNLEARGVYFENSNGILLISANGSTATFIDTQKANYSWTYSNSDSEGFIMYDKFSFNLNITDINGNYIENAIVKMYNNDDDLVVDTTTDSNGDIPEQYVSRMVLVQGAGIGSRGVETEKSPFKLQVTKNGFKDYNETFSLDSSVAMNKRLGLKKICIEDFNIIRK